MKKLRVFSVVVAILFASVSVLNVKAQDAVSVSNDEVQNIAPIIYNLKQGDTLVLSQGNYKISGQAYLKENNITIQGAGKDKTFIYVESAEPSWGITVTGSNCILQDFTLERSNNPNNAAAIKVMGGNNTLIRNVKTLGGYYGIDVNPSLGTTIDKCEISNTSKGSIGIGSESSERTTVTIQNTSTREAGWHADVVINDKGTYGSSTVTIGKGNVFKNGFFYTENYAKSDFIIESRLFPEYQATISGSNKGYVEKPEIQLASSKGSLEVGKKMMITGIISPANSIQEITWTSMDPSIATIDANGEITGVSSGEVSIQAMAGNASAQYKLTVYKVEVSVPDIDVSKPTDTVDVGIMDETSKETINNTSNTIVGAIINEGFISDTIISTETQNNIKNALLSGASIATKVETKSLEESNVNIIDKEQITESIKNLVVDNRSTAKVAQYLDIDIILESQKEGKSENLGEIYQLDTPISFTVAVPEELKKEDRTFYVVRIHNGVSTILETAKNENGTISFETNLFSTYALIYDDKVESIPPTDIEPELPTIPSIDPKPETPSIDAGLGSGIIPGETPLGSEQLVSLSSNNSVIKTAQIPSTNDTSRLSEYLFWIMISLVGFIKVVKK